MTPWSTQVSYSAMCNLESDGQMLLENVGTKQWMNSWKGLHLCNTHCIVNYIWVANEEGFRWAELIIPTHDCAARKARGHEVRLPSPPVSWDQYPRRGEGAIQFEVGLLLTRNQNWFTILPFTIQTNFLKGWLTLDKWWRRNRLFSSKVHVPVVFIFIFNKIPGTGGLQIVNGFMTLPVVCWG